MDEYLSLSRYLSVVRCGMLPIDNRCVIPATVACLCMGPEAVFFFSLIHISKQALAESRYT